MTRRPSTLLFTDIEGSTRLLERLGGGYLEVLGAHRRLLRAAFAQFDGREVGTEGDSFFVVFARASDAVAAAAHGQRALAGHRWPDGVQLRVRMVMHTVSRGSAPVRLERRYRGRHQRLDLHVGLQLLPGPHRRQPLAKVALPAIEAQLGIGPTGAEVPGAAGKATRSQGFVRPSANALGLSKWCDMDPVLLPRPAFLSQLGLIPAPRPV